MRLPTNAKSYRIKEELATRDASRAILPISPDWNAGVDRIGTRWKREGVNIGRERQRGGLNSRKLRSGYIKPMRAAAGGRDEHIVGICRQARDIVRAEIEDTRRRREAAKRFNCKEKNRSARP